MADSEIFANFAPQINQAAIAQSVEHFIRNEKVVGSSPTRGSTEIPLTNNVGGISDFISAPIPVLRGAFHINMKLIIQQAATIVPVADHLTLFACLDELCQTAFKQFGF